MNRLRNNISVGKKFEQQLQYERRLHLFSVMTEIERITHLE